MVHGSFQDNAPRVALTLFDASGKAHVLDCLIDTGFAGQLKLPPFWTGVLRLPKLGRDRFRLADGTSEDYELYVARGIWDQIERFYEVVEMVGDPLIGIEVLRGFRLVAEMDEGGLVLIEPL